LKNQTRDRNFSKGILGEEAYPSPAYAREGVRKTEEKQNLHVLNVKLTIKTPCI